ncbi:hypothetical protein [Oryza sativa Japonica Group]|uniref:Uncharacterized protein n=1 Tax=Oryza sativa subsp. japonica TaxID=39947 RepID=Q5JNS7_ORYSJ|nr:hypothetical protein [Oryza sativa Japonica Group]
MCCCMEHKKTKQKTATLNRAHREACACASPGPRRPRNAPASAEPARDHQPRVTVGRRDDGQDGLN